MKKIIFASVLILSTTLGANAQRNTSNSRNSAANKTASKTSSYSSQEGTGLAKTILLYGNVRFNSAKDASPDELKSTTILFNPGIGYQFNENWAVGLNLALSSSKDETSPTTDVKTTFLQAGPFVRYTQSLGSIFYVYGQAEFGFKSLKIEQTNNPNDFEATGVVANLFPAFAIDLKNKFMVNFSFGGLKYETAKVKDADNAQTNFNFNFAQQVNIGVSKNF